MRLSSTSSIASSLMPVGNWIAPQTTWTALGNSATKPVAGVLHDAAATFRDRWRDTIREERGQLGMRRLYIVVRRPRITSHAGGHYRRQPALDLKVRARCAI
jgi:hypothetical protein